MNLEEYRRRVQTMHPVPSLDDTGAAAWEAVASALASSLREVQSHPDAPGVLLRAQDALLSFAALKAAS